MHHLQDSIVAIPALSDNYIWAITNRAINSAIIVDPGDARPVIDFLQKEQLNLTAILITHHHWDHTNGALELKNTYQIPIFAPKNDDVAGADTKLAEPETINFTGDWNISFKVLDIPAHTKGHIAYYSKPALFCGDTLFASGCGRLFEGNAEQMLTALNKLAALPDDTLVFCAHEYTLNNLAFAQLVEPGNKAIAKRIDEVKQLISKNRISLPSNMLREKQTNPFLRCESKELIRNVEQFVGHSLNNELDVFTCLRQWKDQF